MKRLNYLFTLLLTTATIFAFSLAPASLAAQYCDGPVNGFNDEWITNVNFANVDNTTAFSVSTANTINGTATVTAGEVVAFTVDVTTDGGPWDEAVVIYFDFDNDFVFETELDMGIISINTTTETYDAGSAPAGNTMMMPATPGTYRMRVVLDFSGPVPGPCDADNGSGFKDSEDYEIVVTGGGGPTCDDGMQNGDEEGVDCGGSSCPPCMGGGPTCDDGMQNGDEEGVDCGGSSCPPCEAACQEFTLDIDFDNFSGETSWEVTDLFGNLVDSEDYSSGLDATSESLCLDPGCYEFTIFDSFGDGICCGFGLGSWTLSDDGGPIASGGEFGSSESAFFCTDPGPGCVPATATANVVSYCSNGVFMVQVTVSDLGSASTLAIGNNAGLPFLQNVFFPRTYYVGPFPIGTDVDIFVFDTENSACITMLPGLTDDCGSSLVPNTGQTFGNASVFPNPTTGAVNVNLGSFIGKSVSIEVYNAVGQMIEARQVNDIQTPTESFDLSQQESGIYYIHMNVDGQENIIERVVLSARP